MGPLRAVNCSVVTQELTVLKLRLRVSPDTTALLARDSREGGRGLRGGEVPDPTGTLCLLSRPGRASALLHPGFHLVCVRHCPHCALLSTQDPGAEGGSIL